MKMITVLQALALLMLAVYGASAGVGDGPGCAETGRSAEVCEL